MFYAFFYFEGVFSPKNLHFSGFFCNFVGYKRGGFGHITTLVIHHLKHVRL